MTINDKRIGAGTPGDRMLCIWIHSGFYLFASNDIPANTDKYQKAEFIGD